MFDDMKFGELPHICMKDFDLYFMSTRYTSWWWFVQQPAHVCCFLTSGLMVTIFQSNKDCG